MLNNKIEIVTKAIEVRDAKIDELLNSIDNLTDKANDVWCEIDDVVGSVRAMLSEREQMLNKLESLITAKATQPDPKNYAGQDQILEDLRNGKVILVDPTTGLQKKILFY